MGLAILQGMREAAPQAKLLGVDENSSRRRDTDRAGIEFSNGFTAAPDDVVVLAIPPQRFPAFAMQGGTGLGEAGVIVSVMAGITVRQISQACGNGRVVRAIPNTPAEVAESMTVFFAAEGLPERVRRAAVEVIESFGLALEVSDESQIDDATAICGGGPAFVALVAHAFGEFAVGCGFSETAASNLVSQVIGGTGRLLTRSGKPPMQICRDVMTPNGTTERGIAGM